MALSSACSRAEGSRYTNFRNGLVMSKPLAGIKVIEMAGLGPCPFAGMLLADLGARVVRVDRPRFNTPLGACEAERKEVLGRGKESISVDLKNPKSLQMIRKLIIGSDVLIEGFRPKVMERLGLGPEILLKEKPSLVYGRMTGFGQSGPYSTRAGHDINYISLSGALAAIGEKDGPPTIPLNLLGDFGGGGMLLVVGVLAALLKAKTTSQGEVVDAAMVDGSALMASMIYGFLGQGLWEDKRGVNLLDGGAPFYSTYKTKDDKYIAVGALEPNFYRDLLVVLGLSEDEDWQSQYDRSRWPVMRAKIAKAVGEKTRDEWEIISEGTDSCMTPVLSLREAPVHHSAINREGFVEIAGITQPAMAPRFSGDPDRGAPHTAPMIGENTEQIIKELGYAEDDIDSFLSEKVAYRPGD